MLPKTLDQTGFYLFFHPFEFFHPHKGLGLGRKAKISTVANSCSGGGPVGGNSFIPQIYINIPFAL